MLREEDNPPVLFPDGGGIGSMAGTWWVAHTKPRQEKLLARVLMARQVAYFLPMYDVTLSSRGRTWKSKKLLFSSYVFLCGTEGDRPTALKTGRVATMLPVADQQRLITELSAIHRLIESNTEVNPHPSIVQGTRCRVRSGPLQGIEGKTCQRGDKGRLFVEVNAIGQSAAIAMDGDLLEPVN